MCLQLHALHDRELKADKYWHCTLYVYSTWRKLPVGRSVVATGFLKISPDFLSQKTKTPDKETKFKPPNTSKINA